MSVVSDELYGGLTRPPMLFGVPYELFMLNLTGTAVIFLASNELFLLLAFAPIHGGLWLMAQYDPRMGELLRLHVELIGSSSRSAWTWGVRSYAPSPNDMDVRDVGID